MSNVNRKPRGRASGPTTAVAIDNLLRMLVVCALCGVLVAALLIPAGVVATAAVAGTNTMLDTVPSSFDITPPAQSTKVLANDGETIATFYQQDRQSVTAANMSPFIRQGIVAIEDTRFYDHGGIDPTGILRALVATAKGGREGASTITQQYVNNVIIERLAADGKSDDVKLGGEKSVTDKLNEMKLSIALEKKMSKDDILTGYLNIIYFGNGAYGIQAASKLYFNKDAKDLTLTEAASLAGVVNSPSYYDPLTQADHVISRRNDVLAKLLEQKEITQKQHDDAVKAPLALNVQKSEQGCVAAAMAPYFCDYIQRLIINDPTFGSTPEARTKKLYQGGLTIKTTLDPALQAVAQTSVDSSMSPTDPMQRGAAVVSVQPGTGKVLTMAQNTVYNPAAKMGNTVLNYALPYKDANGNSLNGAGGFQIGSTFKPIIFAEWLNSGHSMMTSINGRVQDYPVGFDWKNSCGKTTGSYGPGTENPNGLPNDDPDHYYPMSAMVGLYNSINTVTFQTAAALDMCNIQKMATAAGILDGKTNKPYDMSDISAFIGVRDVAPINMATVMATFASGGVLCQPIAIDSVVDASGKKYAVPTADCKQTISKDVANGVKYALQKMLTMGSGYAIPLNDKTKSFGKTGTTDYNVQTWTIGANSGISTASWFGSTQGNSEQYHNQNVTINGRFWPSLDGNALAGTQWANVMNKAAENPAYEAAALEEPPSTMLAQTAPLIVGVNDPLGTDTYTNPVLPPTQPTQPSGGTTIPKQPGVPNPQPSQPAPNTGANAPKSQNGATQAPAPKR